MKINWRVRLRNPLFLIQIGAAVLMPILAYLNISAEEITTWAVLTSILVQAVSNPYVIFLVAISVFNATTDPTTSGASDSKDALTYQKPVKREKEIR